MGTVGGLIGLVEEQEGILARLVRTPLDSLWCESFILYALRH